MKQRHLGIISCAIAASGVAACAGMRTGHVDLTLSPERVADHAAWLDIKDVPSKYRTVGDAPIVGPYYILISASGRYCPVDERTYAHVNDDHAFACAWRHPRP